MKKGNKIFYHCFDPGDLCISQDGKMYVIISLADGYYEFINLQSESINLTGQPPAQILKGSTSKQPCSVFDKYNYLYQPK